MLIVDYINDINNNMTSLLDHIHGVMSKYNAFLNVLQIISIDKEVDEGTLELNST